ncbi:MAG: type II toxin-antitoxin system VapC family toxin [Nitrospirota bacterium]|nr:type II toxin-antitoxin system VapC family toxin [Nitrospirota bacterium]
MIVADTNLLIYLYVQGQRTQESEAVLQQDAVWTAPLLWRSEFRNVLISLVRTDALQLEKALVIIDEAERWLTGHEYSVVSRQVLDLASRSGCSAYDCEFVALAQDLEVPLVTNDRQILKAFPTIAVSPSAFTA